MLPVGDYIVAPETIVERKTIRDMMSSIFDGRLFDRFKGYEKINPLIRISSYVKESKSKIFNVGEISNQLNKTINQAKPLLIEMATYGFIIFDTKSGEITIKKKLLNNK